MVNQGQVLAWKWLKEQMKLVRDETLRNAMMAEFRKKAMEEWGYNPDTGRLAKEQPVVLDDWEKEFVEDIRKTEMYELDVREQKRKETEKEARARMYEFIDKGGMFSDLPKDLQGEHIKKLYLEVLKEWLDNNLEILKK